jgi:hypothetical protein
VHRRRDVLEHSTMGADDRVAGFVHANGVGFFFQARM